MKNSIRFLASAALLGFAGSASAGGSGIPLDCSQDPVTDAYVCFAHSELREVAGKRSAPIYMGGPKSMDRTSLTVSVDCVAEVLVLKDRQGVTFAGTAMDGSTPQSRHLLTSMCSAPIKGAKPAKPVKAAAKGAT